MKNIFTSDFIGQTILTVLLLGIVVFFIQKHFENKWSVRIAQETLQNQNFINNKKEAYLKAIDISLRYIALNYSGPGARRPLGTPPTHLEMNACLTHLYIYAPSNDLPKQFKKILLPMENGDDIIIEVTKLFNMIGRDLGNKNLNIDFREFQLIFPAGINEDSTRN